MAVIFGIVLLVIGILGFVPNISPNGMLFWVFHVNPLHNVIHLLSGLIALWVGSVSIPGSKLFFQIFGVIYALLAVLGFGYQQASIFTLIANNMADAWLHLILGVAALYLGFGLKLSPSHSKSRR
jgi:hypothetical protein